MKWENDRIIETVSPVSFKADVDEVDKMRCLAFFFWVILNKQTLADNAVSLITFRFRLGIPRWNYLRELLLTFIDWSLLSSWRRKPASSFKIWVETKSSWQGTVKPKDLPLIISPDPQ